MNIEKFIDSLGDEIYAFALICTKSFDSAAEIFSRTAASCEGFPDDAEFFDIAVKVFPVIRKASCSDNAQTLSGLGLSKKQEALLMGFFSEPQITRAFIHLYYENDLSEEQIAELTEEKKRYVEDRLAQLDGRLIERLEADYKTLCTLIKAPFELKEKAVIAAKSGDKREFEVIDEPLPKHLWTKKQKIGAIIAAIIFTILVCIFIPIFDAYIDSYINGESVDEVPSDLIFSFDEDDIPETSDVSE